MYARDCCLLPLTSNLFFVRDFFLNHERYVFVSSSRTECRCHRGGKQRQHGAKPRDRARRFPQHADRRPPITFHSTLCTLGKYLTIVMVGLLEAKERPPTTPCKKGGNQSLALLCTLDMCEVHPVFLSLGYPVFRFAYPFLGACGDGWSLFAISQSRLRNTSCLGLCFIGGYRRPGDSCHGPR